MTMRSAHLFIWLGAILAVGAGAWFLLLDELEGPDSLLPASIPSRAKAVTIENASGKLQLRRSETEPEWQLQAFAGVPLQTAAVEEVFRLLVNLECQQEIPFEEGARARYGLDSGSTTVEIADDRSVLHVLTVGSRSEYTGARYVELRNEQRICAVSDTLAPLLSLRSQHLLENAPLAFDSSGVLEMRIEDVTGGETASFSRASGDWRMTGPLEADASDLDISSLLSVLSGFRATNLIPVSDALYPVLRERTTRRITLSGQGGPFLHIGLGESRGVTVDGGTVPLGWFVQVDGVDALYFSAGSIPLLVLTPPAQYRERRLLPLLASLPLAQLTLSRQGAESIAIERENEDWFVDGELADRPFVDEFLRRLFDTQCREFVPLERASEGDLDVVGVASFRDEGQGERRESFSSYRNGDGERFLVKSGWNEACTIPGDAALWPAKESLLPAPSVAD